MRARRFLGLLAVTALAACLDEGGGEAGLGLDPSGRPSAGNGVALDGFFVGQGFAMFFSAQGNVKYTTSWPTVIDEFDIAAASAKDPKNAGKYRAENGKLIINWGDGNTWVCRLVSATEFKIESGRKGGIGTSVRQATTVSPTLVGSFKRGNFSYFGVDSSGTAAGSVSGDHWVTFKSDATIRIVDEVSVFINGELLVDTKVVQGDFSISGHTVTITEANGKVSKKDVWVREGTADSPALLAFDGAIYLKR